MVYAAARTESTVALSNSRSEEKKSQKTRSERAETQAERGRRGEEEGMDSEIDV